jgi:hypothetical protein
MRFKVMIISGLVLAFVLAFASFNIYVHALNIIVSHGGSGEIELCVESDGYEDPCDDFNLSEWPDPFRYILDVEDPEAGHDFSVCYEVQDSDSDSDSWTCRESEFTGSDEQIIDVYIPDISPTNSSSQPENDFSLQDPSNIPGASAVPDPEKPALPSLLPP